MKLTDRQSEAVQRRGADVLVSASAGSGKTEVLAQRVVNILTDLERPTEITRLLVVTFTRAAAAELRMRIAHMLRERAGTSAGRIREHLQRQALLLDVADIGTIDSLCNRLVREHFEIVGIDPGFGVLGEQDAALLRQDVLDELFDWTYTSPEAAAAEARNWIGSLKKPDDGPLRELIQRLNRFREHLIDPKTWFTRQRETFSQPTEMLRGNAQRKIGAAIRTECRFQIDQLERLSSKFTERRARERMRAYRESLSEWVRRLEQPARVEEVVRELLDYRIPKPARLSGRDARLFRQIRDQWLSRRLQRPWKPDGARAFLDAVDPVAGRVRTLLDVEARYESTLQEAKRARGAYEFADILRMALDLLGTGASASSPPNTRSGADFQPGTLRPTEAALRLRERYDHILIDEYQDTSPLQVELLRLLARHEPGRCNRFMVGDVKQSIYGFRDAEPDLFVRQMDAYEENSTNGAVVRLTESFRSHERLLCGLNLLFSRLFDRQLGGADYGQRERLESRREEVPGVTDDASPRIEIRVLPTPARRKQNQRSRQDDGGDDQPQQDLELEAIEREAVLIADRIRALRQEQAWIPDRDGQGSLRLRPAELSDIVILLRAARGNAPLLADKLRQCGVPAVAVGRESVLDCREVQDVRNVLALLANRRQDIPMAGYLRGPLVGLDTPELLAIRRTTPRGDFATAVLRYVHHGPDGDLRQRVRSALGNLERWSRLGREAELTTVIRHLMHDTGLLLFARARPGGPQRVAMLEALITLAADFVRGGGRDVGGFVEQLATLEQEEQSPAAAAAVTGDMVRVMTIHAAKGLEFPVVFLAAAGAEFSRQDHPQPLYCDAEDGIGLETFDAARRRPLRTAAFPILRGRQRRKELSESLRLLYVAATRARERLIVFGHARPKQWDDLQARFEPGESPPLITRLTAASMLEWLLTAASTGVAASGNGPRPGTAAEPPLVAVHVHPESEPMAQHSGLRTQAPSPLRRSVAASLDTAQPSVLSPESREADQAWLEQAVRNIIAEPATRLAQMPAVVSVSALKQRWPHTIDVATSEAVALPGPPLRGPSLRSPEFARETRAAQTIGIAVHRFLQHADLEHLETADEIRRQVDELVRRQRLALADAALLNPEDITWFARTREGRWLAQRADRCRREVPFAYQLPIGTASASERVAAAPRGGRSPEFQEGILLRGVIDALVDDGDELAIFDYKTDRLAHAARRERRLALYQMQLRLYAMAAANILGRPVGRAYVVFLRARTVVPTPIEPADAHSLREWLIANLSPVQSTSA